MGLFRKKCFVTNINICIYIYIYIYAFLVKPLPYIHANAINFGLGLTMKLEPSRISYLYNGAEMECLGVKFLCRDSSKRLHEQLRLEYWRQGLTCKYFDLLETKLRMTFFEWPNCNITICEIIKCYDLNNDLPHSVLFFIIGI